ncbi:carbohydrate ABC transporter permease [Sporanaerobium hydrogeniformans]|nr:carbohydrate ABC transporter permease [Sporanaerobium hydrogeniformans]
MMNKTLKKFSLSKVLCYGLLIIATLLTVFPLIYAFGGSFKSLEEFLKGGTQIFPTEWTLSNYVTAWTQANFGRYTWNSIQYTALSVGLTVLTTAMTGYVLSRAEFKGKKLLQGSMGFMIFLIGAVTIYPIFRLSKSLGLLNSIWGMVIAQVASGQAMFTIIIMGYCDGISKEIDEAANIDGTTFFQTFYMIILPLIKPILATVALLTFRDTWNNFMTPLAFTLSKPELRPLTVGVVMLKDQGDGVTAWNIMLAGTIMALVPILIAYVFLNKYFVAGVTDGAVKG